MSDTQDNAYLGAASQATGGDDTNLQAFLIWQILRSISGAKLAVSYTHLTLPTILLV